MTEKSDSSIRFPLQSSDMSRELVGILFSGVDLRGGVRGGGPLILLLPK